MIALTSKFKVVYFSLAGQKKGDIFWLRNIALYSLLAPIA